MFIPKSPSRILNEGLNNGGTSKLLPITNIIKKEQDKEMIGEMNNNIFYLAKTGQFSNRKTRQKLLKIVNNEEKKERKEHGI
mmetsp:Transcript_15967/g.16562  ORF Transcript_15967/g.16562 Transcript_15967/m.16562 type:complete len:82 (+) Transcript_15967:3-248(+)